MQLSRRIARDESLSVVSDGRLEGQRRIIRERVQRLAVGGPEPHLPVAARAEQFAGGAKRERDDAIGNFAIHPSGTRGRMGVVVQDRRPAILHVPPDKLAILNAAGKHAAVAAPGERAHCRFVFCECEQNAAAGSVPKNDAAGPIGAGKFATVGTERHGCDPVRVLRELDRKSVV